MNYKLIFLLSLFGLSMAIATVYWIPSNIEIFFWVGIFVICAIIIAKKVEHKYFMHGFLVSIFNSIWITTLHIIQYDAYVANHQEELRMMLEMSKTTSPKMMMLLTGPLIGAISGLVLGLFSYTASKLIKR